MTGDSVKIYFCDICNESIPLSDLESGTALTIKGRLICQKCNPQKPASAQSAAVSAPSPIQGFQRQGSSKAATTLAVLALIGAAVGMVFFFLERIEMKERMAQIQKENLQKIQDLDKNWNGLREQMLSSQEGVLKGVRSEFKTEVDQERISSDNRILRLQDRLDQIQKEISVLSQVPSRVHALEAWREATLQNLASLQTGVEAAAKDFRTLQEEISKIPRSLPSESSPVSSSNPIDPAGWEEMLRRLKDPDAGVRWSAVIDLGNTKDPRSVEHLIPLLKDEDVFVRNNVALTLGELQAKAAVEDLIEALRDPETFVRDSAYTALKKITGEDIKFDPLGRKEERERSVTAWLKWWKSNKDRILKEASGTL